MFKTKYFISFILSIICISSVYAGTESAVLEKSINAMEYLSHNQRGDVWGGFNPLQSPAVIKFDSGNIYAINLQKRNSSWGQSKIAGRNVLFTKQDKWGLNEVEMNPAFRIDGQDAFVFHYTEEPEDTLSSLHVLIHEMFHQYQFEHFRMTERDNPEDYAEQFNTENLAMMELEEQLLYKFISETSQTNKKEILKDFLVVRGERAKMIGPAAIEWEDHQQKMEGLAEYVAFKLFDTCPSLQCRGAAQLKMDMKPGADNREITERAVKWRHYGVGACLGYALDFLKVTDWKKQIEQGRCSLTSLVAKEIPLNQTDSKARLSRIRAEYRYDQILAKTTKEIQSHLAEIQNVKREFEMQRGVSIVLGSPMAMISGGGTHSSMYHLDNGAMMSVNDTSVSTTNDNGWCLKFNQIPYVLETKVGDVVFKVDNNVVIHVDRKPMTLNSFINKPIKRSFKTISFKGNNCEFNSNRYPGQIFSDQGKITIQFDS